MGSWRFVAANLSGRSLGETRAYNRRYARSISQIGTASFRIRDTDQLYEEIAAGETMLKVFDPADRLVLYGPVIADEEVGQGQGSVVNVQAADLSWRLTKRFVAKKTAATDADLVYTATDSGEIAHDILAKANADEATGITAGDRDSFITRSVTYAWKRASDALVELGSIDGSYEWGLAYADGTPPTVELDLKTKFGQTRTQTFFEYGTGKRNCQGYSRARSIDTLATHVWALGAGSGQFSAAESAAGALEFKRHEDVISFGDISVASLLSALASAHVAVRSRPRTIVNLTPFPKLSPAFGVDWDIGDVVHARVVVRGTPRVSGLVRVWGAAFQIDESGNENVTLQMVADS